MNNSVTEFFNSLKNKTVAFIGIGVSHTSTIRLFLDQGIKPIVLDKREPSKFDKALIDEFQAKGVTLRLGADYDLANLEADVVFRTPGMYFLGPELTALRSRGVVVTSELEVFFWLCPATTYAITGSDGKTTSATVIAKMLETQGYTVHLGGNIGRALLPEIFKIKPTDIVVAELSSFQLISMRPVPDVAVVTNITPNHLDVHASMEEYVNAKRNVYQHQGAFSRTVLGQDSEISAGFAPEVRGELAMFSLETPVHNGAYLKDNILTVVAHGKETPLFHKDLIKIPGMHNVANYLTAISAVEGAVSHENMQAVAEAFGGVEHRIELVRTLGGVSWYNDSIASSPNRTIAGLRSFDKRVILLAGGYDKKLPFTPLAPDIIAHVKTLILAGPTANAIDEAVRTHPDYDGSPHISHKENLAQMVEEAHELAVDGDIVLLSPASTSFDAYPNFEYRGRHFKELVNNLKEKK